MSQKFSRLYIFTIVQDKHMVVHCVSNKHPRHFRL